MATSRLSLQQGRKLDPRATRIASVPRSGRKAETSHKLKLHSATLPDELPVETAAPPPRSASGFVLLDSSLAVMAFNSEAAQALCYPDPYSQTPTGAVLAGKIRSALLSGSSLNDLAFVSEFRSGRRRYFCRALSINPQAQHPSPGNLVLLLERGPAALVNFSTLSQRFHLTEREREVLEYLFQSMSNKQIAKRMKISANTVKVYLRLIMIRTGVSSRSAILEKIIRP